MASTGKPVIASTGGSSLEDIDNLVAFFGARGIPFALNHCVSIYPSRDDELELNQIDFLRERFPHIVVGFSTHEMTDWSSSVMMAYAKGARTFERHIDIEFEGIPVSPYCTRPEQADVWFKAFHTGEGTERARRPPRNGARRRKRPAIWMNWCEASNARATVQCPAWRTSRRALTTGCLASRFPAAGIAAIPRRQVRRTLRRVTRDTEIWSAYSQPGTAPVEDSPARQYRASGHSGAPAH